MSKWWVLAGAAAMLAGCANVDGSGVAEVEQAQAEQDGAAVAAQLGYHGPPPSTQRMGAGAADRTPSKPRP